MKDKYKYLGKNIILFAINGFIPKLLVFVMVPIYTGYLTTYEYGIADLITVTVQLLLPFFTLDIQDAVMRYALDNNYKQTEVFTVAAQIIIKGAILLAVGLLMVSFLNIEGVTNEYLIFVWILHCATALWNTCSLFCRGIDKVKILVAASILKTIVMLVCNILFLIVFDWGLTGYLLANSVGTIIAVIYMFIHSKLYKFVQFCKVTQKTKTDMIKFSFPLIFSVLSWWVNSAADKYIISWIAGISVSGIFAVSYNIPNILTAFQNILAQAWSISAIKEFDRYDSEGFFTKTYEMMNFGMVIMCSICMIMNIPLAKVMFSNEFFVAWKYVPPLLIGVVFNAMALYIGNIFTAAKDTKTLSYSTIIGAVVNIICNVILISCIGAYGAAIATMLGYGTVFFVRQSMLKKYIILNASIKRNIIVYFMLGIQMLIAGLGWKFELLQCAVLLTILYFYKVEIKEIKNKVKFR